MNPEDAARLNSGRRAGFDLVGYQEVGLPYWNLSLNCMVLSHKPIPPLTEFILRTVDAGLGTVEDASGFLGLDVDIVTSSMAQLFQDGYIRASSAETNLFELTQAGQRLADDCEMMVPEETAFPLEYDGWTRQLTDVGNSIKYEAEDLKKLGVWALPAFPAKPPYADEIRIVDVRRLVAETINKRHKGVTIRREILSIEGLHEKRRVFYVKAVALLFKSKQSGEPQVAFTIDGRPSQEHEESFARAAGLKKLGVLDALKQSAADVAYLELDEETIAAIDDRPELTELSKLAKARKREVIELEADLASKQNETSIDDAAKATLEEARENLENIEARLTQYPVRMLEVFEHPEVLEEALREAEERILIVSPWIKSAVVNKSFLLHLEDALKRDVNITICFGINQRHPTQGSDKPAINSLDGLADKYANFTFSALGDTHAKVLVLDHRYVVVTSFNWLSFRGDHSKPFRDERGVLVSIPSKIEAEYIKYVQRAAEAFESEEGRA